MCHVFDPQIRERDEVHFISFICFQDNKLRKQTNKQTTAVGSHAAVGQINKIESVQRWFTKRIKSLSNLTYDERLIKLGNDRFELRRLRADLLMCYIILHHSVDLHQE